MADIGTAIRKYLADNAAVAALVSDRIWPDILKQNATMPAVTYHRVSTDHFGTINGSVLGLARVRLTIDSFADSRPGANALAEAIRTSGILGLGHTTVNGVDIGSVVIDSGQSHYPVPPTDGGE